MARKSQSRLARDITSTEQAFLWHDRLPVGHITVVAGSPSKGKSTLGYRIAADADVPTIFVTTEEADRSVWRPRVEAAGMDLAKAAHHGEVKFSKRPEDLEYLAQLIERYKAKLVVVDPLSNHLRGASLSRDEQVRDVFEPYLAMLQDAGAALVLADARVARRQPSGPSATGRAGGGRVDREGCLPLRRRPEHGGRSEHPDPRLP